MKLCWWCQHCYFSQAEPDWSEVTPGWNATLECTKGHWEIDFYKDDLPDLRANMQRAETCQDWLPIDEFQQPMVTK